MSEFIFDDRYTALGVPYPNPQTMSNGQCEGTGVYPHYVAECDEQGKKRSIDVGQMPETKAEREAWLKCHNESHTLKSAVQNLWRHKEWWFWKSVLRDVFNGSYFRCDGWHFIDCPDCKGTGKRN